MILSILYFLIQSLNGYSQAECNICGWPYEVGVNSSDKCYLTHTGLQGNLEQNCYLWCDAWARQSGISQPASPVLLFWSDAGGAICKCQRLERSGDVGYNTRPNASCDFAYSDEYQNYYDQEAINLRDVRQRGSTSGAGTDTSSVQTQNLTQFFAAVENARVSMVNQYGSGWVTSSACNGGVMLGGEPTSMGLPSGFGTTDGIYFMGVDQTEYQSHYVGVRMPPGYSCLDLLSGKMSKDAAMEPVIDHQFSQDSAIRRVNDGIESVQKILSSNNASIMDELGKIRSKPTGGANLTPVLEAIQALSENQNTHLNQIDSNFTASIEELTSSFEQSLDSLALRLRSDSGSSSTDVTGIERRQNTTNVRLKLGFQNLSDSLSGVKLGISNLDSSIRKNTEALYNMDSSSKANLQKNRELDSLANFIFQNGFANLGDSLSGIKGGLRNLDSSVRRTLERLYKMDSANKANRLSDREEDSIAYKRVMDSLGQDPSSVAQAQQGIQDAQGFAIQGEGNANNLKSSLQGWQSLPGVCSDAPSWQLDLTSAKLGVLTIDLNAYPWVPVFSRLCMRLIGVFGGLMLVMKAVNLLGYNNAKKD